MNRPTSLSELIKSGYKSRSVKEELRSNLIARIQKKQPLFEGIHGYEDTVVPALERAILAGHSINLLGLRGQAKTRMARSLVQLLYEWMPIVEGSEINDDPLAPISRYAKELIAEKGDATPIVWVHRDQRYTEKLATPDVTVADLIGDSDPIKAANLKLDYSDERVIHFGLIPRSHRGIFVINELPDLQPRIQVALFNILQEGDVQIRGFKLRLPLDIQFVFTANPEDYTNRGAIITPLKDRIQSQILTHYPSSIELGMKITSQEVRSPKEQTMRVKVPDLIRVLVERIAMEARKSEFVDPKSGVSARLTISALESVISAAELRALRNGEDRTVARITDLFAIIPAVTGKIELVYEGEQEGPEKVAQHLLDVALRNVFKELFPDPDKSRKLGRSATAPNATKRDIYSDIIAWFDENRIDIALTARNQVYQAGLRNVPGLDRLVQERHPYLEADEVPLWMEFVLHGLAEFSRIGRSSMVRSVKFGDVLGSVLGGGVDEEEEDEG
ncbi:MAG: sigma 54-interacting transcriptional regulator [Flavobacteriales bacterium]|nr:sigma 54-interacting transcriptional regulator [Flavobacteriales bacterium]MBK6945784.1 sigma 54-interacting transcriptional regulator [Flavobacteriales bacterium]MBK7241884.1 sigma 54-interacting transcriptional regulator [Flavobacteriales bacterium]MBK9534665.1 sigma 54-interacting transcriptional regulator [Flavobacteriales bacterium]MBP9138300.1 sigma 54-interacting transcriptional regulator [Flavobacteriales bacterium]